MPAAMPLILRRPLSAARVALRRARRSQAGRDRGQAIVEFAFVIPILSIFLFATVEFGNLMRVQIELDNAVRAGARYLALNPSSNWNTVYQNAMQPVAPDLSGMTGTVSTTACTATPPEVTVKASYSYSAITPVGSLLKKYGGSFNSPDSLKSQSTMPQEC
jgi:Flp pilus assembly protein TadG